MYDASLFHKNYAGGAGHHAVKALERTFSRFDRIRQRRHYSSIAPANIVIL